MSYRAIISSFALLLTTPVVATAGESPWELAAETDDHVTVYNREVPGGKGIAEVKAELIINQPIEKVWKAATDHLRFVEYMPYIEVTKDVGKGPNGSIYVYYRIDPPLVSKREYTLKLWSEIDEAKGVWIRRWNLADDKGPPPNDDWVHLSVSKGYWRLEKLGSRSTLAVYWVYTDPGGSIPLWIANKANTSSLPDVMRAVRNRAADPKWRRDD